MTVNHDDCAKLAQFLAQWGSHECKRLAAAYLALRGLAQHGMVSVPSAEQLEEIKQILQDACDRDWEDESLFATASIAANGLYWRGKEIERLRAMLAASEKGNHT